MFCFVRPGCRSDVASLLVIDQQSDPEKLSGTAFGLFNTSLGLVSLPAPAIGAQLWQRYRQRLPFTLTAWISLLAILPAWFKPELAG